MQNCKKNLTRRATLSITDRVVCMVVRNLGRIMTGEITVSYIVTQWENQPMFLN